MTFNLLGFAGDNTGGIARPGAKGCDVIELIGATPIAGACRSQVLARGGRTLHAPIHIIWDQILELVNETLLVAVL